VLILFAGPPWFRGLLVLAWARCSRTPWPNVGYAKPRSWVGEIIGGLLFGVAFRLLMKAIVMPLLGADPVNQAFHYLAGNRAALPATLFMVTVSAGFGEETVFRGYLFERLRNLFGTDKLSLSAIVLLTSAFFAVVHFREQGLPGVEQAAVTGLVFGTIYALIGRLWFVIMAHATFDLTALALIYWNVEAPVAHWIFR
jgi:hypothetical protein